MTSIITDIENVTAGTEVKKDKRGGKRPGAGRKCIAPGKKRLQRNYYLTDAEEALVSAFVEKLRAA